jgi:hypothetical protein
MSDDFLLIPCRERINYNERESREVEMNLLFFLLSLIVSGSEESLWIKMTFIFSLSLEKRNSSVFFSSVHEG